MNALDLSALEIFRAVAHEGSVSMAASKLNRVQSNVSTRVKLLEKKLGKSLFQRQGRGLTLTDDGRLLLSYAERMLRLSEEATEALNAGRPLGRFRLGTMESTAAARLPAILSRYHALYPDVEIELTTDTASGLVRRLRARDIEAAFLAEPVTVDWLSTRPVFEEALVLITPRSYPATLDLAALDGKTIIAFEIGCAYRRYLEEWLLESGVVPGGAMSVGSYLAILACVAAGTGFAIVPRAVLETVSTTGRFHVHPLNGKLGRIRTLLAWRADESSAKLEKLSDLLRVPC